MTTERHARWQAYVRTLADLLGLRDWRIELEDEPDTDESCAASVSITYGQKHALVYFGQKWSGHTPEYQRYYVCHELLHCHMKPLADVVHNLAGKLGSEAYGVVWGCHDDALESSIDGIGWAVAQFLPLPPAFVEPEAKAA